MNNLKNHDHDNKIHPLFSSYYVPGTISNVTHVVTQLIFKKQPYDMYCSYPHFIPEVYGGIEK